MPIIIVSAEELPTVNAPEDYRPVLRDETLVYDEELGDLPEASGWRRYFAGGSNRPHWVMKDGGGGIHIVECTAWGGSFELLSESDSYGHYENAYDAFWAAEQA